MQAYCWHRGHQQVGWPPNSLKYCHRSRQFQGQRTWWQSSPLLDDWDSCWIQREHVLIYWKIELELGDWRASELPWTHIWYGYSACICTGLRSQLWDSTRSAWFEQSSTGQGRRQHNIQNNGFRTCFFSWITCQLWSRVLALFKTKIVCYTTWETWGTHA